MKISQIIVNESDVGTTTSGGIATVSETVGKVNVRGLEPAAKVMSGKAKKKGPYANSLSEGKKMAEARVDEEDKIIAPGMGRKLKPGFHKIDPDKTEREGETLKNSLHTIIRVATALDKQLSTRDNFPEWVSEKIGATKGMMVAVAEYLQSAKEMKRDPDAMDECGGVIAGGEQYESKLDEKAVSKAQQRFMGMAHAIQKGKKIPGASKELKGAAKSMTKKAGHDFAATKHKGLPEKVKKD